MWRVNEKIKTAIVKERESFPGKMKWGVFFFVRNICTDLFFLVQGSSLSLQNNGPQEQHRWEWGGEREKDTKTHSNIDIKIRKKMLMNG